MAERRRGLEIVLCGRSGLIDAAAAALDRAARRYRRVPTIEGRALRRADVLIAASGAAHAPTAETFIDALAGVLGQRRGSDRPLRVLLLRDGTDASATDAELEPASARLDPARAIVESVDLARRAARLLLQRWPLHLGFDPGYGQRLHLLAAGEGLPADAVVGAVLRNGRYGPLPPCVTLLAERPDARRRALLERWPNAEAVGDLRFLPLDADPNALVERPPVTIALTAEPDAERGLARARRLSRLVVDAQGVSPPLMIEVGEWPIDGEPRDWDGRLLPFSYRRDALDPATLLDGDDDGLARTVHAHYRDSIESQGRDPNAEVGARPWARLPESYREANRHQADHLPAKLALTDCVAVAEERVEGFAFAPTEVERLAWVEHDRWAADRMLDGWRYAPERDNARKLHPELIPFDALSGPMQDLDRFAVRLVPSLLARSGLGVQRLLIVGIERTETFVDGDGRLDRAAAAVFERLVQRHPARAVVVAGDLADALSRRVATIAVRRCGAMLWSLLAAPLEGLLDPLDPAARGPVLALLARAQRRIALPDPGEIPRWLAARAEVRLRVIGGSADPAGAAASAGSDKIVSIDAHGRVHWTFEY